MPRGLVPIATPSCGSARAQTYDVSFNLPLRGKATAAIPTIRVVEVKLQTQGLDCLIGRDVLSDCLFTFEGGANRFMLYL
jgi:hypothetical protein